MIDPTTDAGVAHIARLSRLSLSADEAAAMRGHMQKILAWVKELDGLDTAGVSDNLHDEPHAGELRADVVQPSLGAARALANAPARDETGFAVPKVVSE